MKRDLARYRLPACVAAASALTALAQSPGRPDHVGPVEQAPQSNFQSAFTDYKPFREQKMLPWRETLDELANASGAAGHAGHGGKGGMAGMAGMDHKGGKKDMPAMAGMDHRGGKADMPAMAGMDHKGGKAGMPAMAGMDHKSGKAGMPAMAGMEHKGAKAQPRMAVGKAGASESHGAMAMARPQSSSLAAKPVEGPTGPVSGTGVIWEVNKANAKVKMTHEPIEALGWPRMTMVFRLKDGALSSEVKEGDKVQFSLEKSSSGYVISGFQKAIEGKSR